MPNHIILPVRLLFLLLAATQLATAQSPTSAIPLKERDDVWRAKELGRAEKLIDQHDFSPIDEAFAAKDLMLLWCYYVGSTQLPIHLYRKATRESLATTRPERKERVKLLIEKTEYASNYLRQIPGHARLMGDMIEETLYRRAGGMSMRSTYMECLWRLAQDGSDECIVQLGRYLFDPRDPGFIPIDPARPRAAMYDPQGVRNLVMDEATGALGMAITGRFAFAKTLVDENSKPFKNMPLKDYGKKVRHWWLTSADAAPYRRSLAALGLVLPPGYPPMKEFEGTQTTIAPPLKNPPYPDGATPPTWPEKP
jgi:hypothetical protein